jgi:hypothetical protein
MTGHRDSFASYQPFAQPRAVYVGGNRRLYAYGIGEVNVTLNVGKRGGIDTRLTKTLYVPKLRRNLLSVGAVEKRGVSVDFSNGKCRFICENGSLCGVANRCRSGLYVLDVID